MPLNEGDNDSIGLKLPKLKRGLTRLFTIIALVIGLLGSGSLLHQERTYEKITNQPPWGLYPFIGQNGLGSFEAVIIREHYASNCKSLFGTDSYQVWRVPVELSDQKAAVYCGLPSEPQHREGIHKKIDEILTERRDEALQSFYTTIAAILLIAFLGYAFGWILWFIALRFV